MYIIIITISCIQIKVHFYKIKKYDRYTKYTKYKKYTRELQNIHEALTKINEEHTLNFRMIKPTEKFNFSEPILNSSKSGLIRLSVYNSVFNVNRRNNHFLNDTQGETWSDTRVLAIIPGAYELFEIAELIKEETNGHVIIESDKNTMKSLMEVKQGAINFDIEISTAPLLGFRKIVNKKGKYTSQKTGFQYY